MPCGPTPPHPPEPCRPVAPGQQLGGRYGVESNTNRDNVPFFKQPVWKQKVDGMARRQEGVYDEGQKPNPCKNQTQQGTGTLPWHA